ncbi:MAG: hypothetical protein QME79_14790, partial [Bacillota bacterium]|nr:hypothetical protein [Bacillota bacterium]
MSHTQGDLRSAVRGAAIGACTALIAFAGVYAAAAATQSGIEEASAPAVRPSTTQAGVDVAQETNASPRAAKATASQRPAQAKQPGLAEAAKPTRDVKQGDKRDEVRELAAEVNTDQAPQAPARRVQSPQPAPVQQAPSYPVQQAPSYPVQQ